MFTDVDENQWYSYNQTKANMATVYPSTRPSKKAEESIIGFPAFIL